MGCPSHCSPKKCIPIDFNVIFCKAHPSPIGMCTNPSRDRDGSILPTLMPNLIMYQNTCFAIQALLYSTLDQKWDGSLLRGPGTAPGTEDRLGALLPSRGLGFSPGTGDRPRDWGLPWGLPWGPPWGPGTSPGTALGTGDHPGDWASGQSRDWRPARGSGIALVTGD